MLEKSNVPAIFYWITFSVNSVKFRERIWKFVYGHVLASKSTGQQQLYRNNIYYAYGKINLTDVFVYYLSESVEPSSRNVRQYN